MKIRNLTSKLLEINVEELVGGREYQLYIEPNGTTNIENLLILNAESLPIEILHPSASLVKEIRAEARVSEEISSKEVENVIDGPTEEELIDEEELDENIKEPEIISDKFICDVCGSEFASSRGLTSHKNRVHTD